MSPAEVAAEYINKTHRNIFLTGKAGTGKTTFLREIREKTYKNAVVAAPTGIAAINAGGVTLHSLFQLPFGSFIPEDRGGTVSDYEQSLYTPQTLLSRMQMNATKRKLLNEIELLIIDEVSMLRADLLDAIDHILRKVRRKRDTPFGGVQVLFIGDLLQLPPVVKDNEWNELSRFYRSPFFFEARCIQNSKLTYVELDKVYRQSDDEFVSLLNRFRQNQVTEEDLNLLNRHHEYDFYPDPEDGYIYITTHNRKANRKNQAELQRLEDEAYEYKAVIEGTFDEHAFPHDETLVLKMGAQVMFIKNDPTGEQRFFNGKIGTVTALDEDSIVVRCNDGEVVDVERYTWENKKFGLDPETDEVEEKTVGTFAQYPLRLAWAITVHKSQGLTFERAILDLSDSFTAGQVYVALSRLTSLKGLMLASPIPESQFQSDRSLVEFSNRREPVDRLAAGLKEAQMAYHRDYITDVFAFDGLKAAIYNLSKNDRDAAVSGPRKVFRPRLIDLHKACQDLFDIGEKFTRQAVTILVKDQDDSLLIERLNKSRGYFDPLLETQITTLKELVKEVKQNAKLKSLVKDLERVYGELYSSRKHIQKLVKVLSSNVNGKTLQREELGDLVRKDKIEKVAKKDKKPTVEITWELYKQGMDLQQIAEKRGLAESTISTHLSTCVQQGLVSATEFVDAEKIDNILTVKEKIDSDKMSDIISHLGDEYTYSDVRFALAHESRIQKA
jgi:DNA-binding NarL/FixJ family response regulator